MIALLLMTSNIEIMTLISVTSFCSKFKDPTVPRIEVMQRIW